MGVKHFVLGVNELCSWTLPLDVSIRLTQDVIISNLLSCASRITSCLLRACRSGLPRRLNFLLLLPFLLPFYLFSLSRYNVITLFRNLPTFNSIQLTLNYKLSTFNYFCFCFCFCTAPLSYQLSTLFN